MSIETVIAVAAYSLAWFLVGVLAGRTLAKSRRKSRPVSTPRRKKTENRRQRESTATSRTRSSSNGSIEIYVGNLPFTHSEKDIRTMFEAYGAVGSVRLIKNRSNGKSKGYGFVEMLDQKGTDAAIKALSGFELKGRKIIVNEAKSRSRDD